MIDESLIAGSDRLKKLSASELHAFNEFATRAIATKVVQFGDVVIDLGANEGFHTFSLAALVGQQGLIHAFEPNPAHWKNFVGHPNIRLWPVAVGETVSVENFFIPAEASFHQMGSLVDPRDFLGEIEMRVLTVPQVTIDSLIEIQNDKISFVKMDVERQELPCMRGMQKLLQASRPIMIFENLTPEIRRFIEGAGFMLSAMCEGLPVEALANVLAVPAEKAAARPDIALNDNEFQKILNEIGV